MEKINWVQKLTSRKLWLAVSEFVGMLLVALNVAENVATQIVALIMAGGAVIAYILAEGWVDASNGTITVKDEAAPEDE